MLRMVQISAVFLHSNLNFFPLIFYLVKSELKLSYDLNLYV